MDLYLCFSLYLLWMGWYGSARRLVARSCSQVVPQLPHRGCPNTDSHRSQVDKSSKLFPVCVSQHPVCYLLGAKLSTSVVRSCLISWWKITLCDVIYVDMMWRRIHWKGCSEAIVHYQLQFLAFHLTRLIVRREHKQVSIGTTRNGPTPPFTGSHHWTSNQHRISGRFYSDFH